MFFFNIFRRRKQRLFSRQLQRAIHEGLSEGRLNRATADEALALAQDLDVVQKMMDSIRSGDLKGAPFDFLGKIDWEEVFNWIKTNLIPAVELMFQVAILLMETDE